MAVTVVVHVYNEDPFVAEMDQHPDPKDNFVLLRNPRRRDGKALTFVTDGATAFIYPWTRITFIEVLDESQGNEPILGFFREDRRFGGP